MDPLSAIAGVLGITEVALRTTSALITFVQDAQNASAEKRLLAEEANSLARILERLRGRAQGASLDEKWLVDRAHVLQQFERAYNDLAKSLKLDLDTGQQKPESRLRAFRKATTWSITKSEVYALLERVHRVQQYANALLLDDQHMILEQLNRKQQEAANKKHKLALLAWLSPLQMSQVHQTISEKIEEGSGKWLLMSDKFKDWESGHRRLLWCSGIPGAGKTVLASIIVNHLRCQQIEGLDHKKFGVAVIYLKYNDPDQSLNNILGSLLKQLIEEQETASDSLQALYERHSDHKMSLSTEGLSKALKMTAKPYTRIYFVVDGLDECSEDIRWALVEQLQDFENNVHIMITSRFLDSIQEELEDYERMEITAHSSDVELFIDRQLRKNRNLRKAIQKSPALRDDIIDGVLETADNMFLLAQLHMDALASAAALSIRHVRNKLHALPTTLAGTYNEAMQRVENQDSDRKAVALKSLAWVSYAFRPLSLKELQHAVAIKPEDTDLDEELIMSGQSITALCAGLLVIDSRTNVVNLVHYTTKNYFEQIRSVSFPNFHASITMSCATYLTLDVLRDASVWKILQDFPLAGYAAQYMANHARQNPEEALEPSVLETLSQLLSHPSKRKPLLALLDSLDIVRPDFGSPDQAVLFSHHDATLDETAEKQAESILESMTEVFEHGSQSMAETEENEVDPLTTQVEVGRIPEVTALHLAASMGLAKVAALLMKDNPNIKAVDETGSTALAVAMERGFEKAVEFLVNSGACVNLEHDHGRQVLLLVTERDWDSVAEIICNRAKLTDSEENSSGVQDQIQLLLATYQGDEKATRLLMDQANLDLKGQGRSAATCALFLAVEREHLQIVDSLLAAGVDVNSTDSTGQTSLHRATRRKSEATMTLLLEKGAAVDFKNDNGRTAFSANVKTGGESCMRILLNAGADPNTTGHDGISELYEAAADGEVEYVKVLLKHGTDPSIKTRFKWAPLHWAANNGHIEIVKLLIRAGAELSPVSDQSSTPLDMAIRAKQNVIADLLTRAGAKEGHEALGDISSECNTTYATVPAVSKTLGELIDIYSIPDPAMTDDSSPPDKLSLVLDKPLCERLSFGQFIYPANFRGSKDYYYHLSYPLDTPTHSLSIRRTKRHADMADYPIGVEKFFQADVLYEIVRFALDYQELEVRASGASAVYGEVKMQRGWTGSWKAQHENDGALNLLFRTTPDWSRSEEGGNRWITDDGTLLARSGMSADTPMITFEPKLERDLLDLLVACWVAKLWSENVPLRKHER